MLLLAPLELDRAELSGASFIDPRGSIFFRQKIEDTVPDSLIKNWRRHQSVSHIYTKLIKTNERNNNAQF